MIFSMPRVIKIYLAGYMSGSCLDECLGWRKAIIKHYENWKGAGLPYPVEFLDPFNGPELNTISKDGLKSAIPGKAIVYGDFMSVQEANLLVVNWNTFGQERPMIGTPSEMAWAWMMKKPVITIMPDDKLKEHPFLSEFSTVFVKSVDELLERKLINYYYKRVNSATY